MYVTRARQTIVDNKLIPKKISKIIINYINGHNKKLNSETFKYVKKSKVEILKKKFLKIDNKLKDYKPRNLPIYLMIKEKNKDFNWSKINKHYDINVNTNDIGQRISLASILFQKYDMKKSFLEKKYKYKFKKKIVLKMQEDIKKFFDKSKIIDPDSLNFKLFVNFFEKAIKNKKATIISPICPDYSVERYAKGMYKFTFEKVNSNVGVIGRKILANLKNIHAFFQKYNIKVNHIVAIGDFEVLSQEILERVSLSRKSFLSKLKKSQIKFKQSTNIKVSTPMFTDLCGGLKEWEKVNLRNFNKLKKKKFGNSELTHQKIMKIADARKELYKRWFKNFEEKKITDIIYKQGSEYASMGEIIKKKYKNPLVIGADHNKMSSFYKITSKFPIIYVKNDY